jgi:hypothetical protein
MPTLNNADHIFLFGEARPPDLKKTVATLDIAAAGIDVYRDYLVRNVKAHERSAVVVSPRMRREKPEEISQIIGVLFNHMLRVDSNEATVCKIAPRLGGNILTNLDRLTDTPWLTALKEPLEGVPGFVVAAGPSLDKNKDLLREASKRGVIFVVDMACKSVRAAKAPIDVMVTLESNDITAMLDGSGPYDLALFDLTSNPHNWTADCKRRLVTSASDPAVMEFALACGAPPFANSANVTGNAVGAAYYLGCDPVTTVGNDLAYTDDRCYTKESIWGDDTVEDKDGRLHFKGKKVRQGKRSEDGMGAMATAWGGEGHVKTSMDFVMYGDWFGNLSRDNHGKRRLINANEGGMSIAGWEEIALKDVIDSLPEIDARDRLYEAVDNQETAGGDRVREIKQEVKDKAQRIIDAVRECRNELSLESMADRDLEMRYAQRDLMLMNAFIIGPFTTLRREKGGPPSERRKMYQDAVMDGATQIMERMG